MTGTAKPITVSALTSDGFHPPTCQVPVSRAGRGGVASGDVEGEVSAIDVAVDDSELELGGPESLIQIPLCARGRRTRDIATPRQPPSAQTGCLHDMEKRPRGTQRGRVLVSDHQRVDSILPHPLTQLPFRSAGMPYASSSASASSV